MRGASAALPLLTHRRLSFDSVTALCSVAVCLETPTQLQANIEATRVVRASPPSRDEQ